MKQEKKAKNINKTGISFKTIGWIASAVAVVISAFLIGSLYALSAKYNDVRNSTSRYIEWKEITVDVQRASDLLTDQVRAYVVTGSREHLDNYFDEANFAKRREKALETIKGNLGDTQVFHDLEQAIEASNNLMIPEFYAMRLTVERLGEDVSTFPKEIKDTELDDTDKALSPEEKKDRAIGIVFGDDYNEAKKLIIGKVNTAIIALDGLMEQSIVKSTASLKTILVIQQTLIGVNVIFLVGIIILLHVYVIRPINNAVDCLLEEREVEVYGSKEYRYLAETYNSILSQNVHNKERLLYEAEHDKLTGLYNRTGYDSIYRRVKLSDSIYILVDVDKFKSINDTNGHEVGDEVLIKVATAISKSFPEDYSYVFRIGGDEFSIILENASEFAKDDILSRFRVIFSKVNTGNKDVPGVTLSVGVAYGKEGDTRDSLFKKADTALYYKKRHGRGDVVFYDKSLDAK